MPTSEKSGSAPLAYLITLHSYGSWLHGEAKGSVDRLHNLPGTEVLLSDEKRLTAMEARRREAAVTFSAPQRQLVHATIHEVCQHRGWELYALNVRTNHVHVVVAGNSTPEKMMNDFKAWATRRLREADLVSSTAKVWSRHGSTRWLWNDQAVEAACRYVLEGQGPDLD